MVNLLSEAHHLAWESRFTISPHSKLDYGESALRGASLGMGAISGNLALRVLRNSLAGDPHSPVGLGTGWRSPYALRAIAEWISDGR